MLTQRELHDRLAQRGVMRVRAAGSLGDAMGRLRAIAPDSHLEADEIVVPGPPSLRPVVLDALRDAGVEIRGLTAEEGRLDTFYRELVGDSA